MGKDALFRQTPVGLQMKYFILKPKAKHAEDQFAAASQAAMHAFADAIEKTNDVLAAELRIWARKEAQRQHDLQQPQDQ
jgi:hypothetical protein